MTLSAFEVLGVFPERGRLPTPEEDAPRGPSVALLSHELWVTRYGADPSILGRTHQPERDAAGSDRRHARGLRLPDAGR